ncbi:hypothetical protein B0H13DRAFT_2302012 [Mycena leptocephala]|nr:hypothetical protein B0H13DRAFT_2302012 [Mycena leptocephala]
MASPSHDELQAALGISKLHARLRAEFPAWAVSEKRLVAGLDVAQWTPRVAVRVFDRRKGKGLAATAKIAAGEAIWLEDPFVIAAEWWVAFH